MAVITYETVFIAEPEISNEQADQLVNKIKQTIGSKGGTVTGEDRWGRRRLAFTVQGFREGFYVVLNYTAEPTVVAALEHLFNITDSVIRHLTIRVIKKNKVFRPRRERPAGAAEGRPSAGSRPGSRPPRAEAKPAAAAAAPEAVAPAATPEGGTPA